MSSDADVVVSLDDVWKRYRLGSKRARVSTRRTLNTELQLAMERAGLRRPPPEGKVQNIWALAGISIEVRNGEALGIIGPNGSGKSTILKLISKITDPWSGDIKTRGRIGSLIEIKSGIHPELTGRENIYLYGTILGLPRKEIRRRFDEIVEFAELERFIDTPVKRYSSGMEVRLGFSVAVHLEPDILLIDEVLAVGDESFQRRCLARMDEMRSNGQTLVFVSHVMADVKKLCPRVIYLDRARVKADGDSAAVIDRYMQDVQQTIADGRAGGTGEGSQ